MRTRVTFAVELSLDVDENWQEGAGIAQIVKDAHHAASARLRHIMPSACHCAKIKMVNVSLFPKAKEK